MKIKRLISFIIIAAILISSVLSLTSCDKPEIYKLIEMILNNKQDGSSEVFNAEINIKINKNYLYKTGVLTDFEDPELDALPDEINIKFDGKLHHSAGMPICQAVIDAYIENENYKLILTFHSDGALYFENNELSRIILDLLTATGFADYPVKQIFSRIAYAETGKMFRADLKDFDLSWFERYAEQIEKTFTITSAIDVRKDDGVTETATETATDIDIVRGSPNFGEDALLHFSELKARVEKELLKVQGYRYSELSIVLSPDNYMHVLGMRENGARELLEPVKSDIGLKAAIAKIKREPKSLWTENIIPMRYLLELMGESVEWDNSAKKPFILREGEKVHFNAAVVNSCAYINLTQILTTAQYHVSTGETGDYLELKIIRR